MGLEGLTESKSKISGGFGKKFLPLVLTALVLSFGSIIGCKPTPGPISIENSITPSSIQSGSYANWQVKVTNYGGEVVLESASGYEEIMNGYFEGQGSFRDIPVAGIEIPAHTTTTIAQESFMGWNTTGEDVRIENTVTVYYDNGKKAEDTTNYTLLDSGSFGDYSSGDAQRSTSTNREVAGAVTGSSR